MKFGKHLQKRQLDIPEYAASFVDYKALKRLIKQLSATPVLLPQNASTTAATDPVDPQAALHANRATFFFKVDCELTKVNAFYLLKEAELKLRLKTLLDKKRVMQARTAQASKRSTNFVTLEESFQQFGNDLNKLQQFVDINATAFSKILKKWDKASKSRTKELYLSRAVEVQPCFNQDVISDLSDQATTSLLELAAWAEGENIQYEAARSADHTVAGQSIGTDNNDTDAQILQAASTGNSNVLQEWISRLRTAPDASDRFTRVFLSAISDAPEEILELLFSSGLVDIQAEDDINERNCLHEAAISGRESVLKTGLMHQVDVSRVDVYGRIPLHYACLHGHVAMVRVLLEAKSGTINDLDHDNFTPLIHTVVYRQLECAHTLMDHHARIEPQTESDHVPLNLACQYGSIDIARLLLEKHAKIVPDTEGLYPQHLLAKSGQSPEALLELEQYGADLNQCDKLYQWTPLFHAAAEGRVHCLQVLLQRHVDPDILDEKGHSALYYAAWEGHLECMKLLGSTQLDLKHSQRGSALPDASVEPSAAAVAIPDADGIPDLSLPPPIIPLRRYGHNFLDSKTLLQLSFDTSGSDAIEFYNNNKYPAARLTISSKSSDVIPRNIMLPIQEESRTISFQINKLDSFALDFDIFPTFGSKVIAKSIALSSLFTSAQGGFGYCCLPLFDPRLRAIGQIGFHFQVIRPFRGMPLDITHFATYWRATSQLDSHPAAFITGSSLSGHYVRLFVQTTSDGVPVLYPNWTVKHFGIDIPIMRLTYDQFVAVGSSRGKGGEAVLPTLQTCSPTDIPEIHRQLAEAFSSLRDVLRYLPTSIHVDLQILFPTPAQERRLGLSSLPNINDFADAVLRDVFDHARTTKERTPDFMRSVVFSSYNVDICTALNWKQPNYPVLLCNDLGAAHASADPDVTGAVVQSSGHNSLSLKEAVRTAQSNNFMGLVASSGLLEMVPPLTESIKAAGLVLVADTSDQEKSTSAAAASSAPAQDINSAAGVSSADNAGGSRSSIKSTILEGVNGVLHGNGMLQFSGMVDM